MGADNDGQPWMLYSLVCLVSIGYINSGGRGWTNYPPFHGGDTSSNLVGDANLFNGLASGNGAKAARVSNTGPISTPG